VEDPGQIYYSFMMSANMASIELPRMANGTERASQAEVWLHSLQARRSLPESGAGARRSTGEHRSMEDVMANKPRWKTLLSVTFLSLAMVGGVARAESIPIVTGQQWMASTDAEKQAYLVGIANLLDVERAYADGGNTANSDDIAQRFGRGMQGQTLDSVRESLDSYYKANPTMIQHPVIETLWFQMVVPGLNKSQ